jgi:hypothetical protein
MNDKHMTQLGDDHLSSGRRLEKNDDSHGINRINTRHKTAPCSDRFRTIHPILSVGQGSKFVCIIDSINFVLATVALSTQWH